MEKTPRYTQRERNMVLGYAARHKDIIENKRTDAESNRKKDEVWLQIAKEFNARAYHQRSAKQLRQLYKNMKLLLKKDLSGEDRGNRSFMDLLDTLAHQDSVAQYITEQMSPDSAGGASYSGLLNGSGGGEGTRSIKDDFDDSKMHYDNMDAEVILIKSETISDNEGENGMHGCMDDDDDDDCLSPKAPEVCLEETDEELFATDLRQMNQAHGCSGSSPFTSTPNPQQQTNHTTHNAQLPQSANALPIINTTTTSTVPTSTAAAATISALQCPTPTSPTTSIFGSGAKPEITIQNVGGIRVGAFASLSKTLQNGNSNSLLALQPVISPNPNSAATGSSNGSAGNGIGIGITNAAQLQLTPEQVQQHLLLNGLGLSAVHPPASVLPTLSTTNSTNARQSAMSPSPLPLSRTAMNCNGGSGNGGGMSLNHAKHLLLNGHNNNNNNHNSSNSSNKHMHNGGGHLQLQQQTQLQTAHGSGGATGMHSTTKSQQNEYLMKLTIEERKLKIELLNAQIEYWQTLTKKLDANGGHYPTPSCLCHFPGGNIGSNAVVAAAAVAAAANGLQSQSSSS